MPSKRRTSCSAEPGVPSLLARDSKCAQAHLKCQNSWHKFVKFHVLTVSAAAVQRGSCCLYPFS